MWASPQILKTSEAFLPGESQKSTPSGIPCGNGRFFAFLLPRLPGNGLTASQTRGIMRDSYLGWCTAMNELCLTVFVMLLFLLNVIVKPR